MGSRTNKLRSRAALAALVAFLALGCGVTWLGRSARAADHFDPPARTNVGANSDVAADIADLFIWNTATTVTMALTGAGPSVQGLSGFYDTNLVFLIHVSNDGNPATDEATIDIRYGRDPSGKFGVQFLNVPGSTGPIVGPVQTILTDGPVLKAIAGVFDDPFFFDAQGLNETRMTGVLSIRNTRNIFADKNDTSFVIEVPRSAIANGTSPITIWAESRRIPGAP